jgi:hypothetical protein
MGRWTAKIRCLSVCFIHHVCQHSVADNQDLGAESFQQGGFSRHEEISTNNKIENDFNLTIGLEFGVSVFI